MSPDVGVSIRGEGRVIFRDVTRYGLHRMKVSSIGKYPDLETWCSVLQHKQLKLHNYTDRIIAGVCECVLELYWKEG